jgi:hypothetical protein
MKAALSDEGLRAWLAPSQYSIDIGAGHKEKASVTCQKSVLPSTPRLDGRVVPRRDCTTDVERIFLLRMKRSQRFRHYLIAQVDAALLV